MIFNINSTRGHTGSLLVTEYLKNVAVVVFRHTDRGLHSVCSCEVFPSRQYPGANICIDHAMDRRFHDSVILENTVGLIGSSCARINIVENTIASHGGGK